MNIIIINHYAGSPDYGMEFRPFYLAKIWIKLGHNVTVVAADYSHLRNSNPIIKKSYTKELIDGITYVWIKTPEYKGNGVKRVFNMFTFVGKLFLYSGRLIKDFSPDVVISSSTYPLDIHASKFIAKKSNAKLIFEVHDIWPLTPMEVGGMSKNHPFVTIMQHAEDKAYKVSDSVVSMLPCAKEHMLSRGMIESKYNHIPNGICLDEWEVNAALLPAEHKEVISSLKKKGFFIFGYAGGHALSNSLTTVIDAVELLKDYKVAVNFSVVGDNADEWVLLWDNGTIVSKNGEGSSFSWMEAFQFEGDKIIVLNQYSKPRN